MINYVFPVLNGIDQAFAGAGMPAAVRIAVWGAISGAMAMGIYALLSNQTAIGEQKDRIKAARAQVKDIGDDDFDQVLQASLANLRQSFRLLRITLGPSMISSVPVVIVILWCSAYYSFAPPENGAMIDVQVVPAEADVWVVPATHGSRIAAGRLRVKVDAATAVRFESRQGAVYEGIPLDPPEPSVQGRQWWNLLIGSEAGYLADAAGVDEIRFGFDELVVVNGVHPWLSTWIFTYFSVLMLTALGIKFGFKID